MKIAIVDLVMVLDQSKLGLAGAKKVEELYHSQQRELAPMIAAAKNSKRPNDQKQLEARAKEQEGEREHLRAELRQGLLTQVQPIIQEAAKEASIDFVLARPQAMLFAKPELDLTNEVIRRLDLKSPA